jgi:polyisoprenoid-binding protein YceI
MMKKIGLCIALVVLNIAPEWEIRPGYAIRFRDRYATGEFRSLEGRLLFDPDSVSRSSFVVKVETASIETGNGLKNRHARSAKWFDAAAFPYIEFRSDSIRVRGEACAAFGKLLLHGVERSVTIPFAFEDGAVFRGRFRINRVDFGIGKPRGGEADSTDIEVTVPVVRR